MPTAVNNEFWADIVKYVQHPDQLDALLADMDKTVAGQ
jgi:hypothetical protein